MKNLAVSIALAISLNVSACDMGRRALSGDEVYDLFADKTVTGTHEQRGYDFVSYYSSSVFRSYQDGATTPRLGDWWLEGDLICISWHNDSDNLCRTIYTDDRGNYWKALDKSQGEPVPIVTYHSLTEGNPNGL